MTGDAGGDLRGHPRQFSLQGLQLMKEPLQEQVQPRRRLQPADEFRPRRG